MLQKRLIVIGGSWGGFGAAVEILKALPVDYGIPILLVLHRQRNVESELAALLARKIKLKVTEVEEKEELQQGYVYLAPPNYHVLIERDLSLSLDSSEPENYSRPAIDVTFMSAATVAGPYLTGILLSGASRDGSKGLCMITEKGGAAIAQDPLEAEVSTMPQAAIDLNADCRVLSLQCIKDYLISLHDS